MSTATDMLTAYITAETTILKGQSYMINGHSFTRADLSEVQKGREYWQAEVNNENAKKSGSSSYAVASFN